MPNFGIYNLNLDFSVYKLANKEAKKKDINAEQLAISHTLSFQIALCYIFYTNLLIKIYEGFIYKEKICMIQFFLPNLQILIFLKSLQGVNCKL